MAYADTKSQRNAHDGGSASWVRKCERMWRPWHDTLTAPSPVQHLPSNLLQSHSSNQGIISGKVKLHNFQHPVKLFWPKSKCFDFLYQEAEELLRNFPVQATIALYQESDSSSESEDEDMVED
ncbi:protein ripply2.1-like [Gastrophryne carolinensis]